MSLKPIRMPDYPREVRRQAKPLLNRGDAEPRVGKILGIGAQELMDAIAVVCSSGCAVLFSPTSDGGALSVTVYHGDERDKDYASSAEEFASLLLAVRDVAEAHAINNTHWAVKAARNGSQTTQK